MDEISLILKDNKIVSMEEFRILDNYAVAGKIWTIIRRDPYIVRQHAVEYIFDSDTLLLFRLISQNILATWDTDSTRYFGPNDEFDIGNSLYIRLHGGIHL